MNNKIDLNDPLYDLFSTQEERDDYKRPKVYEIPLNQIDPFPNHPFQVNDDEEMYRLVQSIEANGVITPALVRTTEDPDRYQMLSGHRRLHACMILGLETIPCIKVDVDDDTATLLMVESNYNREKLLPSEKAWSYKMRNDALKRKAGRPKTNSAKGSEENSRPAGENFWTVDLLAQESQDSARQIQRYIRLTELIPDLLDLVDKERISVRLGSEIAHFDRDVQKWLNEYVRANAVIKPAQIELLRDYYDRGFVTSEERLISIMRNVEPVYKTHKKVTLKEDDLMRFFPSEWSEKVIREAIINLLIRHGNELFGGPDDHEER